MFDANPRNSHSTNIASIFCNSLAEVSVKLATIPPFLVLVAPRHTRSQRSYPYIIPDRQISLDNNVVQLVCCKCKKTKHSLENQYEFYSCSECDLKYSSSLTSPSTDATITCYCQGCQNKLHAQLSEAERLTHPLKKINTDKHKLNLFAVLCIETSHYVAFVKCKKQNQEHEWLFFDSMSDRVGDETNVPLVDGVPNFDQWIEQAENDQDFFKKLDERRSRAKPTSQTFDENGMRQLRLFRDGAFFFYENSNVNYQ
jgi:ubiquitin thioesterase CYLD